MSKQLALDTAMHAQVNAHSLSAKCRNAKEEAAWTDCLELYGNTIMKINEYIDHVTSIDVQTWLSTALTNLETCERGFIDFGMTDYSETPQANIVVTQDGSGNYKKVNEAIAAAKERSGTLKKDIKMLIIGLP
ncbi:pectinesterase 2 [Olea europaea subsp. europaea]|uniref:Pectinesterase 2 n=1 Tax=Olea europaea subsp. europaea TaxID=158383 RepID=A0A8S0TJ20_OLEEU|nr:pectinesterase 2 [Olea europaea subsp. europaea]